MNLISTFSRDYTNVSDELNVVDMGMCNVMMYDNRVHSLTIYNDCNEYKCTVMLENGLAKEYNCQTLSGAIGRAYLKHRRGIECTEK